MGVSPATYVKAKWMVMRACTYTCFKTASCVLLSCGTCECESYVFRCLSLRSNHRSFRPRFVCKLLPEKYLQPVFIICVSWWEKYGTWPLAPLRFREDHNQPYMHTAKLASLQNKFTEYPFCSLFQLPIALNSYSRILYTNKPIYFFLKNLKRDLKHRLSAGGTERYWCWSQEKFLELCGNLIIIFVFLYWMWINNNSIHCI